MGGTTIEIGKPREGSKGFLQNRWTVLAVLFLARLGVGFQFITIAALMPLMKAELGYSYTQLGLLLGLFLVTGIFLSLPSGIIATRYGDHNSLRIGLGSLIIGSVVVAWSELYILAMAGRLLGGVGAVFITVVGNKLVTDWFIGREISTALSIFGVTWPVGIALGMSILPSLGEWYGWEIATVTTMVVPSLSLLLLGLIPRTSPGEEPPHKEEQPSTPMWSLGKVEFRAILLGGLAMVLMNGGGYILLTSYGPALLIEQGATAVSAGLTLGILSWVAMVTIPFGGYLADRTGKGGLMFWGGCFLSGFAIAMFPLGGPTMVWLMLSGAIGLTVGPVMALPSGVLSPGSRATGFGVFFTIYYIGMSGLPALGGWMLDRTGSPSMVMWFAALCLFVAPGFYYGGWLVKQRWSLPAT